ncbi:hypothetical protein MRB53_008109 [Persea americana]|uniref:Uncharacterized protein n=1 Tax=Persea americana TaxID=3435 RepID=A0ACC2MKU9_PERAE|nr:hypothetical protein MRB53_008109 [Persea americana]
MEEELKGREFFGGDSLRFVDLVVGLDSSLGGCQCLGKWEFNLLDAEAFPSLHAWGDRFPNVPFIQENLPSSDRLHAIFTNTRKGCWLNK